MSTDALTSPVAVGIATRIADLAAPHEASTVRVSVAPASYGSATFSGKARSVANARPDTDLADDLLMLMSELAGPDGKARVATPSSKLTEFVRIEREGEAFVATLIPRTLFSFPIRGA